MEYNNNSNKNEPTRYEGCVWVARVVAADDDVAWTFSTLLWQRSLLIKAAQKKKCKTFQQCIRIVSVFKLFLATAPLPKIFSTPHRLLNVNSSASVWPSGNPDSPYTCQCCICFVVPLFIVIVVVADVAEFCCEIIQWAFHLTVQNFIIGMWIWANNWNVYVSKG